MTRLPRISLQSAVGVACSLAIPLNLCSFHEMKLVIRGRSHPARPWTPP